MYIEPKKLKLIIKEARKLKRLTPELAEVVRGIARGLYARYRLKGPELEDVEQEAMILVSLKLQQINPNGSVFNFLTTMIFNLWRHQNRGLMSLRKKQQALATKLTRER